MDGVFVPLLLPVAAWPLARVASGAPPRLAVWLLTCAAVALAAGSTAALAVLAFAGLSLMPPVARFGDWSPQTLRGMGLASVPWEVVSGLVLGIVLVSTVVDVLRKQRWLREVARTIKGVPESAGLVVLPDAEPLAFAVPLRGGRIVVSRSMLAALTPAERCALLAHERAHLRHRHHVFLTLVSLATSLNPLLRPLRSAVVFLVERWADEVSCARVGDRRVVAVAVGKAALAARTTVSPLAPAATGGSVPRRVAALLDSRPQRSGWRLAAVAGTAFTIAITMWSAQASVEAAADLHKGIEVASLGHHHPHRSMA
ncbi:M56 family metallopeptidase [Amycolatopsis acidiphila]|uniref:M56 family metallopeptidase n=1 Tax=Amycolatopsis acidiphila TaxID=715473 RepID=A0A558AJ86_9PSEU|nr:M56 family metallopeptidase [Amycolatopsis acidiphila]TVT24332.1 M56 family metallopeptidase [Amycolatopsis acidiphila]UIJ62533.1 M56 family metallopeptidase [Amycolatopsis acidiphila]GHG85250.1 peptidase M48 [Amycolatopsis acidiphila]